MNLKRHFLLSIALGGSLLSAVANAASSFENNTLLMPYLVYQNELYRVNLHLVENSNPADFSLGTYTKYDASVTAPETVASYTNNVVSIPNVRVDSENYQVQLDFIDSAGVFRLQQTPVLLSNSTDGVLCNYSDSTPNNSASLNITSSSSWVCSGTSRLLTANGIPDHEIGTFPNANNPNTITEQSISASLTLTPSEANKATTLGGPAGTIGYVLNGVKIDAGTGGTCNDTGSSCDLGGRVGNWSIEALGQTSFNFGTDMNNAHVQPNGEYHYHGIPEEFVKKLGGDSSSMTLIAWAADGFPIYARYGHSEANDAASPLKSMTGSYQYVSTVSTSRPAVSTYPLGTFAQDWTYVAGSGDLDECNGRFGVTPEFPQGIYHYYATDTYPFFQRCVKGAVETTGGGFGPPPGQ